MMPMTLPNGTGMRARHFTPMVVALVLVGTALVANTVGKWMTYTSQPSSWTQSPERVPVTIGDIARSIPANMMRHSNERAGGGEIDTLHLAVLWPSLEGYSQETARAFADPGDRSPVLSLSLRADTGGLDTNERFERVWMSLAAGDAFPGPEGLALLPLAGDGLAGTDFVAHRNDGETLFAARCFTPRDQALAANCERTIRTGAGLLATYRFRQVHLRDWRSMDGAIATLVASFAP
ncbi:hypothetical protein [Stappia sp. ES.058]|uniref:hypothetical protein n=1 Tax=Stappia sp. ES.058 TaxID=1881061 RepID=UPI00087BA26F|nr:hypothetical protein [Stappia sp. ES.058]SDU22067.1 hypothetical protein SAMN05428979_2356 [Stappia sp. ES.058]